MQNEPIDQFFTNLAIYNLIKEKELDDIKFREMQAKNGQSS
jgi:hypothetical protein